MAQHIGVSRVNEQGKPLARATVNAADVHKLVHAQSNPQDFLFLMSIDEYGDTYFNGLQRPMVITELERLKATTLSVSQKASIDGLIEFLRTTEDQDLVRFIGD